MSKCNKKRVGKSPLSLKERSMIEVRWCRDGRSVSEIARELKRDKSSISREVEEACQARDVVDSVPASEKQRQYLYQIITQNVDDEEEREQRLSQIDELTKQEAGRMIESFLR